MIVLDAIMVCLWFLLGGAVALVVLYDVLAKQNDLPTISWMLWTASQRYPVIPLAIGLVVGLLCGHLFWRVHDFPPTP